MNITKSLAEKMRLAREKKGTLDYEPKCEPKSEIPVSLEMHGYQLSEESLNLIRRAGVS